MIYLESPFLSIPLLPLINRISKFTKSSSSENLRKQLLTYY